MLWFCAQACAQISPPTKGIAEHADMRVSQGTCAQQGSAPTRVQGDALRAGGVAWMFTRTHPTAGPAGMLVHRGRGVLQHSAQLARHACALTGFALQRVETRPLANTFAAPTTANAAWRRKGTPVCLSRLYCTRLSRTRLARCGSRPSNESRRRRRKGADQ